MDPDHLDIYGTEEAYRESFMHYASLVESALVVKATLSQCMAKAASPQCKVYGYGVNDGECRLMSVDDGDEAMDFYADNVRVKDGEICFDFYTLSGKVADIQLGGIRNRGFFKFCEPLLILANVPNVR
jgi:UDP-N-acetylmuramate--alanine ligase